MLFALLALLIVMNARLRYPGTLLEQLEKFRNIGAYSLFFEQREIHDKRLQSTVTAEDNRI